MAVIMIRCSLILTSPNSIVEVWQKTLDPLCHVPVSLQRFVAVYASTYMQWLPEDGLVLTHLKAQKRRTEKLVLHLSEDQLRYRYAPGKWTIKEIMVHLIDDERIYAYRALRIGRGDSTPLPGFRQDDYVPCSRAGAIDASYRKGIQNGP